MIFRNWVLENFPFLEDDFDALTDYQLFCKMMEYVKEFAKDNEDFNKRLTDLENYFNNLDVQEEIDNKLDEMVESGELENIISQYIELATTYVYNTVDDMINATNLINGSYARTSGFYQYDDKGGAYYKVRTKEVSDTPDNIHLFELNDNTLVAELIVNDYNLAKFGAKSGEDITDIIEYVLSIIPDGETLYIPTGEFSISNALNIDKVINILGTSNQVNKGSILTFNNTNGLILNNSNIEIKHLYIKGTNKPNYSTLDISNDVFGIAGIICNYSNDYTSGAIKVENCNITGFNVGIVMYSARTVNKWAGAYRKFINNVITYNDIGYLVKDMATYNSIIGNIISSNEKFGIYASSNIGYQNLEVIDTDLEVNGDNTSFTTTKTSFGVYSGENTTIRFSHCYLENLSLFVNNGIIVLDNSYIHNNVHCFGIGQIVSNNSHGMYGNVLNYGDDLATNSGTSTNVTITNSYGTDRQQIRIQCDGSGNNWVDLPDLTNLTLPAKYIKFIKFECDVKVVNGYQVNNFGIYPSTNVVAMDSGGNDRINQNLNYSLIDMIPTHDEWVHLTYYMKPRIGVSGYIEDVENEISKIETTIYFVNNNSDTNTDFTTYNLDMQLANPKMTIIGDTLTTN